jgi:hypothetical protein
MTLEWLRRCDPVFDQHLRTYLFREGDILRLEHEATEAEVSDGDGGGAPGGRDTDGGSLGLGGMKAVTG